MNREEQKPKLIALAVGALSLCCLASACWSQPFEGRGGPDEGRPSQGIQGREGRGPGGRGRDGFGPRRGGRGGGPGARRDTPKAQLLRWLEDSQRLEKETATPLTKAQARQILALAAPWRKKKAMTEQEASALYASLNGVLTPAQKAKIAPPTFAGRGMRPGRDGDGRGPRGERFGRRPDERGERFDGFEGDGPHGDGPPPGGPGEFGPPPGFDDDGAQRRGPEGGRRFGGGRPEAPPEGPGGGVPMADLTPSQRDALQAFGATQNPLAAPKSNANFAKLPSSLQTEMTARFERQNQFFSRLKKVR